MDAWPEELWPSIVMVTAKSRNGSEERGFGSGFVVCVQGQMAWVVTCAHVIDDRRTDGAVFVNNKPAEVCTERHPDIDLAVLRVPNLPNAEPLELTTMTLPGSRTWIPGWHSVVKPTKKRDPLIALLGAAHGFSITGALIQRTFDLDIEGFGDARPPLKNGKKALIHPGYSGAPVVCTSRRAVLAVASIKKEEGESAYAVSVEHLPAVWPADAPTLPWLDAPDRQLLDAEAYRFLMQLFGALPSPLTLEDLKRHCRRCAPSDRPLDYPAGNEPVSFFYWLIGKGPLSNGHVPLYDVLARLEPLLQDDLRRQRLRRLREAIALRYPDIHPEQPGLDDLAGTPTGLEIELIAPSGATNTKRWDYEARLMTQGSNESQVIKVREGQDKRLRPDDPDDVAALLDWLLREHVPSRSRSGGFSFVFKLPRKLIATPVDRWHATDGDPLGLEFPVIVQDADRHAGQVVPLHWCASWDALAARMDQRLSETLCWCDGTTAEAAAVEAMRRCARLACEHGKVVALTCPLEPGVEAEASLLNHLLDYRGASVMLWPQQHGDPGVFQTSMDAAFAGFPLEALPEAAWRLRREREDDPERPDANAHFTLLWDPFVERRRPGLFGSD